jgi:thiol-disulfide isomerase/thioredoxin
MSADQRTSTYARWAVAISLALTATAALIEFWGGRGTIAWTGLSDALERAKSTHRPVYLDVTASWCAPCRVMDRTTFRDDSVRSALSLQFVPARVDIDDLHDGSLVKNAYGIAVVPTSLVLTPHGEELARHIGYLGPDSLLLWLRSTARGKKLPVDPLEKAVADARERRFRILAVVLRSTVDVEAATSTLEWIPIKTLLERKMLLPIVLGPSDSVALKRLPFAPVGEHLAGVLLFLTPTLKEMDRASLSGRALYDESRMLGLLSSSLEDSTRAPR